MPEKILPKKLFFDEFSKTLENRKIQYFSFFPGCSPAEELDELFNNMMLNYGKRHFPVYRLCDAEYMYIIGRKLPRNNLPLLSKISFLAKTLLINLNIINQKTWHGENYSVLLKRRMKKKYLDDLKKIAQGGYLAPHLLLSEARFCEEYNDDIVSFFERNNILFSVSNYFPFYFVYVILSLKKYKKILFEGKNVLIITSFNERKQKKSFEAEFVKEGVSNLYFYEISPDKSMLETIDHSKLPLKVDLVLIGAGVGSANIINQLTSLNAICIDAGHALDCFSKPELRKERICLLPDEQII